MLTLQAVDDIGEFQRLAVDDGEQILFLVLVMVNGAGGEVVHYPADSAACFVVNTVFCNMGRQLFQDFTVLQ